MPHLDTNTTSAEQRRDAEALADIIMYLQRSLILHLSKELARGNVSFPQYFLLSHLCDHEVAIMSEIAQKMGHTTAAATGMVDRLGNMGYVTRAHGTQDRRKVIVRITEKGMALVEGIREDVVANVLRLMAELEPAEQKCWLQIYRKINTYCLRNEQNEN
ncbi:MAG TPA: MarR family transcriptional regulator [Chthoniobacterales bacterium]